MVCNGHYSEPITPKYPGIDLYKGQQMHSHEYRNPNGFKGKINFCNF